MCCVKILLFYKAEHNDSFLSVSVTYCWDVWTMFYQSQPAPPGGGMKFSVSNNTKDLGLTFRPSHVPTYSLKLALAILASCFSPQTDNLSSGSV